MLQVGKKKQNKIGVRYIICLVLMDIKKVLPAFLGW